MISFWTILQIEKQVSTYSTNNFITVADKVLMNACLYVRLANAYIGSGFAWIACLPFITGSKAPRVFSKLYIQMTVQVQYNILSLTFNQFCYYI